MLISCIILAQILASASYDDTIKLYIDDPTEDWYCFATLTGHTSTVWSLAWSPDGRYLASASDDKIVRVWKRVEEYKWECVLAISAHDRTVYSVSWSIGRPKSGKGNLGWLATAGDGSVKIWELTVSAQHHLVVLCIVFNPGYRNPNRGAPLRMYHLNIVWLLHYHRLMEFMT